MVTSRALNTIVLSLVIVGNSVAGTAAVSDNGIRTLGSSLAYIAHCEKESHIAPGTSADFMLVMQSTLTTDSWLSIKNEYQKSLHDKKQYSVAKKQWIPFQINGENCTDLYEAIPIMKATLRKWAEATAN